MPGPRTSLFYRNRVAQLTEEGYKAPTIARKLAEEAAKEGREDSPNERTVRRIRDAHLKKKPEDRVDSEPFYWPDSMAKAGLPWEASRTILDLLRHWYDVGLFRPQVRLVKWYWRIHLGALEADYDDKITAAQELELAENLREPSEAWELTRAVEAYLAYAPWRATDDHSWRAIMKQLLKVMRMPEDLPIQRGTPESLSGLSIFIHAVLISGRSSR